MCNLSDKYQQIEANPKWRHVQYQSRNRNKCLHWRKTSSKVTDFQTRAKIQYEQVKYNKCVRLPDSMGVLDCDSQFTILSPLSFDGPQLWCSVSVCSSLHLVTRAHCVQVSPSVPSLYSHTYRPLTDVMLRIRTVFSLSPIPFTWVPRLANHIQRTNQQQITCCKPPSSTSPSSYLNFRTSFHKQFVTWVYGMESGPVLYLGWERTPPSTAYTHASSSCLLCYDSV